MTVIITAVDTFTRTYEDVSREEAVRRFQLVFPDAEIKLVESTDAGGEGHQHGKAEN